MQGYETMDWEAEAKRIARAFGVEGECHFEVPQHDPPAQGGSQRIPQTGFRTLRLKNGDYARLANGVHFWCDYRRGAGRNYWLRASLHSRLGIKVAWGGQLAFQIDDYTLAPALTKGSFHLGLLTSEIEAALKANVTAHEKLEWTREYEERYGL